LPVFAGAVYVSALIALVASAEQKNDLSSCDCIIDPISRPDVYTQFPDAVAAKLVIAEVAQFNPDDSPVDCDPGFCVADLATPFQIRVPSAFGKVMAYFEHREIIVYKRTSRKIGRLFLQ
jgi:hypothetical protein